MIPLASPTVLDGSTSTVNFPPLRVLTVNFIVASLRVLCGQYYREGRLRILRCRKMAVLTIISASLTLVVITSLPYVF